MGNRLSKITTRTGDQGMTGLGDGSRISKDDVRIHAMGDVDELNTQIGVLLCEHLPDGLQEKLLAIQHDLFDVGGELSIPGYALIHEQQVTQLDAWLEQYNANLTPLKEFILPGGSRAAALAHVCRTVCRRAERSLIQLDKNQAINPAARHYINRLSDLLFVWSRILNQHAGQGDVLWARKRHA